MVTVPDTVQPFDDLEAVRRLALSAGLEDGPFEKTIASFGVRRGGALVGCVALKLDGERYSVEWLAVADGLRGKGLGSRLVDSVEHEARRRGAGRLWALARAPGFFEKLGYRRAKEGDDTDRYLANCRRCSQYQQTCWPAIMFKDLQHEATDATDISEGV